MPDPEAEPHPYTLCHTGDTAKGRVWVHGDAATAPGLLGFVRSARKEPRGELLRCVFAAGASSGQTAELVDASRTLDLVMNMFLDGRHGSYRNILTQVTPSSAAALHYHSIPIGLADKLGRNR